MKRMTLMIGCALFVLTSTILYPGNYELPANYLSLDASNCRAFEPEILKCIDFLETAPQNDFSDKRKDINSFLMRWLTLTPDVSVSVLPYVMDLSEKNKTMLLIFMCGWAKYSIKNSYDNDKMKCNRAALESIIRVYQKCEGVVKDEKIDALVALKKDNKLNGWLKDQLK